MALFEVEVTMNYGDRHWQNRWEVTAADLATAAAGAVDFAGFHQSVLLDTFIVATVLTRPPATRNEFIQEVVDVAGDNASAGKIVLPLFNTMRVLLATASPGRPGQKFLRGLLTAEDLAPGNLIDAGITGAVQTHLNTLISNLGSLGIVLVEAGSKVVTHATAQALVQERQLHRKRRKALI